MTDNTLHEQISAHSTTPEENFERWRAGLSSLFDSTPINPDLRSFKADLSTYNLGNFLIGVSKASAQTFKRDHGLVSAVGIDHLLVQLYVSGDCEFEADGRRAHGKAGDLVCFDLSRPMSSRASDLQTVSLVVPRALLRLPPRAFDGLHGAVLDGNTTLGILLREHLLSMARVAPRLTAPDGKMATEVAAVLVSAGLSAAVSGTIGEHDLIGTGLQAIQTFIERNLTNEALSPEMIMRQFGLSRSALYRTFEPLGGIAEYIRARRLNFAFLRLASIGTERGAVAKLAYMSGFSNEAAFSRAFKQKFGLNPRTAILDADQRARHKSSIVTSQDNWLQTWLEGLNIAGQFT